MGAIGGLLGIGGGQSGTGIQGPQQAAITNPTSMPQINAAYTNVEGGLTGQQQLLQALQSQQGLQNQSNVYAQLQDIVAGRGANPAQAMLNQSTGQNVANQSALMAGQRGASQNAGLIARQAAQQGANIQQQAAGQAATMQANQSLNALGQAGQLANTQAANQIGQTNTGVGSQQNEQQLLLNALQGYNSAQVGSQSSVNAGNAQLANTQLQGQHAIIGGVLNGVGGALGLAEGGQAPAPNGPQSNIGKALSGMPMATGGNVGSKLKQGGKVPGSAPVPGPVNDYANDVVDAKLSPGEIVIPNKVTKGKDPVGDSAKFVAAILAKRGKK